MIRIRPKDFPDRTISPKEWHGQSFYRPVDRGFEREIGKRLAYWTGCATVTRARTNNEDIFVSELPDQDRYRRRSWTFVWIAGSAGIFPMSVTACWNGCCARGQIKLDGKKAKSNQRVTEGQLIRIPPLADRVSDEREKAPAIVSFGRCQIPAGRGFIQGRRRSGAEQASRFGRPRRDRCGPQSGRHARRFDL